MKRVLIADDDPAILDAISVVLEDAGYEVVTEEHDEIYTRVLQTKPDIILLDIWMSGHNGREICKKLKSDFITKNIPIILVSANKDTRRIAQEVGAEAYLEKPFDMCELLARIKKLIEA